MTKKSYSPNSESMEKISTFATTMNLIKLIFGFGTFILPYLTYLCGWLTTVIFFIIGSSLMIWSAFISDSVEKKHRNKSGDESTIFTFTKLTGAILGRNGMIMIQVVLFFTILFMTSFYLSAIGTMLSGNKGMEFKGSNIVYIVICAFGVFGLSFIQNQKLFSFANMFGITAVLMSIVLSVISASSKETRLNDLTNQSIKDMFLGKAELKAIKLNFADINKLLSGVVFLLSLSLCVVEFRQQIKNPNKNYKTAILISIIIAAVLNLVYALVMAVLLKDSFMLKEAIDQDMKGGLLNNETIKNQSGDLIVVNHLSNSRYFLKMIITFSLSLNLLFSMMIITRVPVTIVVELMGKKLKKLDDNARNSVLIGIKFTFVTLTAVLAITVKKVDVFCDIIGAVCFPVLAFNFPAFFYLEVNKNDMKLINWVIFIVLQMLGGYFVLVGIWLALFL